MIMDHAPCPPCLSVCKCVCVCVFKMFKGKKGKEGEGGKKGRGEEGEVQEVVVHKSSEQKFNFSNACVNRRFWNYFVRYNFLLHIRNRFRDISSNI